MSNARQWHCGNPVCFCTGDCMGKTHASPTIFTQSVEPQPVWPNDDKRDTKKKATGDPQ